MRLTQAKLRVSKNSHVPGLYGQNRDAHKLLNSGQRTGVRWWAGHLALKVGFFQKVRIVFHTSQKIFQISILNYPEFEI